MNHVALCCLLLTVLTGDTGKPAPDGKPGTIIMVEGIGGINLLNFSGNIAFKYASLPHEVRPFYWSHGTGQLLKDLQDSRHFQGKVDELVRFVGTLRGQDPDMPIFLVGHSAGTGLIVEAAAKLPANSIDRIVLLSSALSPNHDLRPALAASRGGIVSYHSSFDAFVLNWGTNQFGTIDRHYGPSAGYQGFKVPDNLSKRDQRLYRRLVQIPWSPAMILQGNLGTHNGTVFPSFLSTEVARWLK